MPGGGLFALVAYGAQNVILSGNPDFTYFYKTFRKYAHFAEESVSFSMDGAQDLSYDQPIQLRLKIQRIADLVRDVYFVFNLPDIYCKFISLPQGNRTSQYNFSWVNFIGTHIIQQIGFYIGGQKIQEFDGDYMMIKAQCDLNSNAYQKWQTLVGNVPELYDPVNGLYHGGKPSSTNSGYGYPLVYNNNGANASTTIPPNVNRPSISGRRLQIPIPFWFAESTFEALPLVSLQYHECEIQVTLRPIRELYRILDVNGYPVAPGYQFHPSPIGLQPQNVYYTSVSNITDVTINNFLTDIGTPVPLLNTWPLQPAIQMTYVYVTDEERAQFSKESLQYLVRQVTAYDFPEVSARQFVELDTHNPIERILVVPRRSDSILYRNQMDNFTNWVDPSQYVFVGSGLYASNGQVFQTDASGNPLSLYSNDPNVNEYNSTGIVVQNGQRNIMSTFTILGDGNPLQEDKPLEYYTQVVPWKYLTGTPDTNLIIYPFALASPGIQPQGSINSSRIKSFQLDLNVNALPANTFYQYDITVYVESLNWVTVSSGMGGLKYAL